MFSSSHANHTKQSIPYSQFLRLRRVCSEDKDFETKSLEMRTIFVERGYPTHLLDSAIQKAFNNSRRDTLKPRWPKLAVIFKFLKTTLRRQPFSPITLLSLLDAIKTFEIIKCTVALDRIYRHKRVPFLALVLVVTRVHSSTLAHLFPDLNPISSFGTKRKTKE